MDSASRTCDARCADIGLPGVLKTRRLGYDGKGQCVLRKRGDIDKAWAELGNAPLLYEADGALRLRGLRHRRARPGRRVRHVSAEPQPARGRHPAPDARAVEGAQRWKPPRAARCGRVMEHFDYVGVLAIEFFVHRGRLLANEMAPRVHNSGHWTIEGAVTSQFENHVRAIAGLPLGSTAARGHSAMLNLIGTMPDRRQAAGRARPAPARLRQDRTSGPQAGAHDHCRIHRQEAPSCGPRACCAGSNPVRSERPAPCTSESFKLRELPFRLSPDPEFLYLSKNHSRAKAYMESTIWFTDGFVIITGEIGAGKTTLIETFLRELEKDVVVAQINQTQVSAVEFLQSVLVQFGFKPFKMKKAELLATLNSFLIEQYTAGRKVLLIVDEAQNLSLDTLEEIRMLSGVETTKEKVLRIILAGQPELNDKLDSPELVQLAQRVRLRFHLTALRPDDVQAYVLHRLEVAGSSGRKIFAEDCFPLIYRYTGGVPRLINTLCDTAMMAAFTAERDHVLLADVRVGDRGTALDGVRRAQVPRRGDRPADDGRHRTARGHERAARRP